MCISLGVSTICFLLQNQGDKGCLKLKDMLIAYHHPIFQSGRSVMKYHLCIQGLIVVIDLSDIHLHLHILPRGTLLRIESLQTFLLVTLMTLSCNPKIVLMDSLHGTEHIGSLFNLYTFDFLV